LIINIKNRTVALIKQAIEAGELDEAIKQLIED